MSAISPELKEKFDFIDAALTNAQSAFSDIKPVFNLYGSNFDLIALLANAYVPNLTSDGLGLAPIPEDQEMTDKLPIYALLPGEKIQFNGDTVSQTPRQKLLTREQIEKWGTEADKSTDILAHLAGIFKQHVNSQPRSFSLNENYWATAYSASMVLTGDQARSELSLTKLPTSAALVQLKTRPCLIVQQDRAASPEVLAHEIVHMIQKIEQPIATFGSQKQVDMKLLRDELMAYHVGATIYMQLIGITSLNQLTPEDLMANTQLAVEYARSGLNDFEGSDPFMPTSLILKKLSGIGLGHILHTSLNFETTLAALQA